MNELGFSFVHKTEQTQDEKQERIVVLGGLPDLILEGPSAFIGMAVPPEYSEAWERYTAALELVDQCARRIQDIEKLYAAANPTTHYNPSY